MSEELNTGHLEAFSKGIKNYFEKILSLKLEPIVDKVESHEIMLRGKSGLNGLSGTVKEIAGNIEWHSWSIDLLLTWCAFLTVKVVFDVIYPYVKKSD